MNLHILNDVSRYGEKKGHRMKSHFDICYTLLNSRANRKICEIKFYSTPQTTSCIIELYAGYNRTASAKTNIMGASQRLVALRKALQGAGIKLDASNLTAQDYSIMGLLQSIHESIEPLAVDHPIFITTP